MEYNQKMIDAKTKLLERFKEKEQRSADPECDRLPPGQHLTKGFPVLDLGVRPKFYEPRWRFKVDGEVARPHTALAVNLSPQSTQPRKSS